MDRKQLRKAMSPAGWIMLVYYLLMTVCAFAGMLLDMIFRLIGMLDDFSAEKMEAAFMAAAASAWGYFLAAGVGLLILLAWKKPAFWKHEIWARGAPMKAGDFFGITAVFISIQLFNQLYLSCLEWILNGLGLTIMVGMDTMTVSGSDSLGMLLYMGVLAPISEELLCRGLVQRTLLPYGKKLAILGSAFLFGMMHGNIVQTPFAFAAGLVLGYVAAEYSIAWAMVLHLVNNMLLGDSLSRILSLLDVPAANGIFWAILVLAAIGAAAALICKRRKIRIWNDRNVLGPTYARCFFASAGVVTFTVVMVLLTIVSCFMLITPLAYQ